MARIPDYQRQIREQIPQPAAPPPGAFGGQVATAAAGLGQAAAQVGQTVAERALELQEREDQRQALEAENRFRIELDALIYDPEKGLENRKLSAARGVTVEFDRAAAALRDKYLMQLPGQNQREQFSLAAGGHIAAGREYVLRHEAQEIRAGEDQTFKDARDLDVAAVVKDPSAENIDRIMANSAPQWQAYGRARGWAPEHTEKAMNQARGVLAVTAIDQTLVAQDTAGAKELFDKYKGDIALAYPDKVADIEKAILDYDKAARQQAIVEQVLEQYGWREAEAGRKHIREKYSGEEEDDLIRRYGMMVAEQEAEFLQAQSNTYDNALERIAAAGSYSEARAIAESTGLKIELRDRLIEYAADKFNRDLDYPGAPKRTDMKTFWSIIDLAGEIDPKTGRSALLTECPTWQKFLDKYGGKLSISDQRQMRNLYENAKGEKRSDREVDLAFSRVSMMNRLLDEAGIDDPIECAEAWKYVTAVVGTLEAQAGRELDPEEFTKWAKWSLENVVVRKRSLLGIDLLAWDVRARRYDIDLPPGAWFDPALGTWLYKGEDGKTYKVVYE